ncbi:MAG TPA: ABC transporter permease, partial [Bryobacteraceae bacterium]
HYQARRQFGNRGGIKERTREMTLLLWLDGWLSDLRFAVRRLRKEPGFALMALLSLALGIGANTAVYTLINSVMLKQLPVSHPAELVSWGAGVGGGVVELNTGNIDLFPYDFARRMEDDREMFADTAFYGSFPVAVSAKTYDAVQANRAVVQLVSGGFFHLLGVPAMLGRTLELGDASAPAKSAVAVLSYTYWQRQFSGDRSVIGKPININGSSFEIIGVAPEHFFGVSLDIEPDMWAPITMQPEVTLRDSFLGPRGLMWVHLISRMRPGTNFAQAQGWTTRELRLNLITRAGASPGTDTMKEINQANVELQPAGRGVTALRDRYSEPLEILIGVTGIVLLIACVNLASFSLARMASREKEMFARLALGAGRARIVRQVLTEGLTLSLLGGLLGLAFASWASQALFRFVVANGANAVRSPLDATPDASVLVFTIAAAILTGVLFSLIPALRASQVDIASRLRVSSRGVIGDASGHGRLPLARVLVAAQVALSLVLLAGAALFVRTLQNLDRQGFGFNPKNALLVEFDARAAGYRPEQIRAYYDRLIQKLDGMPGVQAVSLSAAAPISHHSWRSIVFTGLGRGVLSRPVRPGENLMTFVNAATPRYFETCGIPLAAGRVFDERDSTGAENVAVVSQMFAHHFFPNGDVLDQLVSIGGTPGQWRIVGVVADGRYNGDARGAPPPMIYLPLWQMSGPDAYVTSLEARMSADPESATAQLRRAFAEVDPQVAVTRVETFVHESAGFFSQERLISRLSGFFSIGALLLASIGLYGVMSHSVARRSNEIGVRMALGAESASIRSMILKESLVMLAAGLAVGAPASLAASRAVRSQLFGVSPFDPLTLVVATLVIAAVSLLAGSLPAWRASKVDPMTALRDE